MKSKIVLDKRNKFLFNSIMKFSCKTQDLLTGLQLVNRAIGSDQVLPILQNILIHCEGKRCTLSATNLEVSIVTSFEVMIENEGSITIPAKAALHFMQYQQDVEVVLETSEGTQLKIQSKHAKAVIAGEAASGFPTITAIQKETIFSLPVPPLLHALNLVTFACAKTSSRPVISGVFVRLEKGNLILVGTDSYRLSEYRIPVEGLSGEISCIIPARFMEELKAVIALHRASGEEEADEKKKKAQQIEKIDIALGSQQIEVVIGPTRLTSRLIDGKFPDYQQVLPKEKATTVLASTRELLTAVKRMHYFAKELNNNITFGFTKTGIHLTTKQTQLGKDESTIQAELTGQENKIAVSSTYLIDFLTRLDSEKVHIELLDKMHPAVFRSQGSEVFLHLIMPLRMNDE